MKFGAGAQGGEGRGPLRRQLGREGGSRPVGACAAAGFACRLPLNLGPGQAAAHQGHRSQQGQGSHHQGQPAGTGQGGQRANRDRSSLEIWRSLEMAMQAPLLAGPADHQAAVQAQALGLPELALVADGCGR